jgi:hypothetical protein
VLIVEQFAVDPRLQKLADQVVLRSIAPFGIVAPPRDMAGEIALFAPL